MDGVVLSGSKSRLLEHVRSLLHCRGDFGVKYRMRDLPNDSGEYLSALCDVHSLILLNTTVEHTTFATLFSAFVTLVDYFPNITSLELDSLELEPDEGLVPSLSRPLRGKAHIHFADYVQDDCLEFYDRFAKLNPEYEEVVVNSSCVLDKKPLRIVLQMSTSTVKFLRLTTELQCE